MRHSKIIFSLLGLGLAFATTVSAHAQTADELTAEQLAKRFNSQKTRGLVIAPADDTTTQAAQPAATQEYVELEEDQQVNVQISFDFDSAALRADQKPKLDTLCQVIKNIDIDVFRIVGHTDASGSESYNERLSLLRAEEVKRHMVGECGIPETRLQAVGVGEQFPINKAAPRADENRRVEFQALS